LLEDNLLELIINLQCDSPISESEDQQVAYLENLISFMAFD